jgi:hypothetical protein
MTPTPEGILTTSEVWVVKPDEDTVIPAIEETIVEKEEDNVK